MLEWMQEWSVCKMNRFIFSLIVLLMFFSVLSAGFVSAACSNTGSACGTENKMIWVENSAGDCSCSLKAVQLAWTTESCGIFSCASTWHYAFYSDCETAKKRDVLGINQAYGAPVSYTGYPFKQEGKCVLAASINVFAPFDSNEAMNKNAFSIVHDYKLTDAKIYSFYYPWPYPGDYKGTQNYGIQTYFYVKDCLPTTEGRDCYAWVNGEEQWGFCDNGRCMNERSYTSAFNNPKGNKCYQIGTTNYEGITTFDKFYGDYNPTYGLECTKNGNPPARLLRGISQSAYYFFYDTCYKMFNSSNEWAKSISSSRCDYCGLKNSEMDDYGLCAFKNSSFIKNDTGIGCYSFVSQSLSSLLDRDGKSYFPYINGCPAENKGKQCYKIVDKIIMEGICQDEECINLGNSGMEGRRGLCNNQNPISSCWIITSEDIDAQTKCDNAYEYHVSCAFEVGNLGCNYDCKWDSAAGKCKKTNIDCAAPIVDDCLSLGDEEDKDKIYNIGHYSVMIDGTKADVNQGVINIVFKSSGGDFATISSSKTESNNGKIDMILEVKFEKVGGSFLNTFKQIAPTLFYHNPPDVIGLVIPSLSTKKEDDLFKEALQPYVERKAYDRPGELNGKVLFTSKDSKDKNHKTWLINLKGSSSYASGLIHTTIEHINTESKDLGPYKREDVALVINFFKNKAKSLSDNVKNGPLVGDKEQKTNIFGGTYLKTVARMWEEDTLDKTKGAWHTKTLFEEVDSTNQKTGKVIIEDNNEKTNIFKRVIWNPSDLTAKSIEDILKEINEREKEKTPSTQSVWMFRDDLDSRGIAYHFSPPFKFNKEITLVFNETEGEALHLDDSLIDYCNYTIINSSSKLINQNGGEINILGYVTQIFPENAVLNETNFSVEVINITSCNHCTNYLKDEDEGRTDCGGSCSPCIKTSSMIDCSNSYDCIYGDDWESFGFCVENKCDYNRDFSNIVELWKENQISLYKTIGYLKEKIYYS